MKKLIISGLLSILFTSCNTSTSVGSGDVYVDPPRYICDFVYDTMSGQQIYACFWYANSEITSELDLASEISDLEKYKLEKMTAFYSEKFSLSSSQSEKIAKNILDFDALTDRSSADVADFAKKLYGVNSKDIINAVSQAQFGEYESLDALIEKAAVNFKTSPKNMKAILNELHGQALRDGGIEL